MDRHLPSVQYEVRSDENVLHVHHLFCTNTHENDWSDKMTKEELIGNKQLLTGYIRDSDCESVMNLCQ